jgi:hypothetical protein
LNGRISVTTDDETVPLGDYIKLEVETPLYCDECDDFHADLVVSNEVVVRGEEDTEELFWNPHSTWGLDAVIRFLYCGTPVVGAIADPLSIAYMLEKYEAADG